MDARILSAARALLAEQGYDALSFEALSKITAVSRPAIYRRWPTKAHLAAEIAYEGEKGLPDLVDGRDLRAEVAALVHQVADQYRRPEIGAATIGLITAYQKDERLRRQLHSPAETKARDELRRIVSKAKAKQLMREEVDADILFDTIVGSIIFRLMFSSVPPKPELIDALTDQICVGIQAVTAREGGTL